MRYDNLHEAGILPCLQPYLEAVVPWAWASDRKDSPRGFPYGEHERLRDDEVTAESLRSALTHLEMVASQKARELNELSSLIPSLRKLLDKRMAVERKRAQERKAEAEKELGS